MKGKSLFKKIGAIATTAAMLASVGVTGFATEPKPAGDNDNKGIIVNAPTVTEWDVTNNVAATTTGVYKVDVSYETDTDVTNSIGVTMLAYGGERSLTESDISTGYTSSMKIVGVDQINTADVNDIKTGTFTFYVDTNEDSTNAQIKMAKGQTGIVLLSGDGADGANGVLFRAGNVNATVVIAEGGSLGENNEYDAEEVARPSDSAAEIAAVKNIVTTKLVLSDGARVSLVADDLTVTPVTGKAYDYDSENSWQEQICEYTVKVTKAGYDITNNDFTVKVTYAADTWTATSATGSATVALEDLGGNATQAAVAAKVAEAAQNITLTDGTNTVAATLAAGTTYTTADPTASVGADSTVVLTATVPPTSKENGVDYGQMVVGENVTATITVTVTDSKWDITGIKLADGTESTVAMGEFLDTANDIPTKDAIDAEVAKLKRKVVATGENSATGSVAESDVTITCTDDDDYDGETIGSYTLTYEIKVAQGTAVTGSKPLAEDKTLTVTATVTIKGSGTSYILGDVDGKDGVTNDDWQIILWHRTGKSTFSDLNDPTSKAYHAADIDGKDGITNDDWQAILWHRTGKSPNENIGKEFKF